MYANGLVARITIIAAILLLLGIFEFVPVAASRSQAAYLPAATVRWPPPELADPIRLQAPPGFFAPKLQAKRDYVITCPAGVRHGDMLLAGDPAAPPRHLVLIGCRSHGRLIVQYFSGIAHIEGTWWNPEPAKDGIDCGGPAAPSGICRVQNTRITGLSGSSGTVHADCLQPWGRVRGFQIDRFTCDTNYQGEFLAPANWVGFVDQSRANLRHNNIRNPDGSPGILFWVGETDQLPGPNKKAASLPFRCRECYAKVRSDMTFLSKGLYPGPRTTIANKSSAPLSRDGGRSYCWKNGPRMFGDGQADDCKVITLGDPPGGDFATSSLQYGYKPSGYGPLR